MGGVYNLPPYKDHLCALLPAAVELVAEPVITDDDLATVYSSRRYGGNSIVQRALRNSLNSLQRQNSIYMKIIVVY